MSLKKNSMGSLQILVSVLSYQYSEAIHNNTLLSGSQRNLQLHTVTHGLSTVYL